MSLRPRSTPDPAGPHLSVLVAIAAAVGIMAVIVVWLLSLGRP